MAFALTEELLLGADIYFAENGETIDTATVAIDALPDNDPTTNWTDRQFGKINRVKMTPTYKTQTRESGRGLGLGGYLEEEKRTVVRDVIEFTTLEYNELHHRLSLGLTANPTPGTGQTPFADRNREILGWVRIVAYKEDGSELFTAHLWVKLKLGDVPEWKNEEGSPVYMLEFLGSGTADLDDVTFPS